MIKCPHCGYTQTPEPCLVSPEGIMTCVSCTGKSDLSTGAPLVNEIDEPIKFSENGYFSGEYKYDPYTIGTIKDGFILTEFGWVEYTGDCPPLEIVNKALDDARTGFSGMWNWVHDPEVMSHMLERGLGFIISKSLVFEGDRHYQMAQIPLVYAG